MAVLSPIIGCKYTYYGRCSLSSSAPSTIITLRSPTSVVPVLDDGCAYLMLEESGAPPIVPQAQLAGFSDLSRRSIYSSKKYNTLSSSSSSSRTRANDTSPAALSRHTSNSKARFALKLPKILRTTKGLAPSAVWGEGRGFITEAAAAQNNATVTVNIEHFDTDFADFDSTFSAAPTPAANAFSEPSKPSPPTRSQHHRGGEAAADVTISKAAAAVRTPPSARSDHDNTRSSSSRRPESNLTSHYTAAAAAAAVAPYSDDPLGGGEERGYSDKTAAAAYRDAGVSTSSATSASGMNSAQKALSGLVNDDTVAALQEATSQAAKSIFSFAAMSLKTVVEVSSGAAAAAAAAAGVQQSIQLGNTRVMVIRELAQGGFGTVFLVQEIPAGGSVLAGGTTTAAVSSPSSGNGNANGVGKTFALKQMICQSKEQVEEAHSELKALQKFAGNENIIELIDHSSLVSKAHNGNRVVNMLFPLYPRGTAWDAVERANPMDQECSTPWPFNEKRALTVCAGIARGLHAIHQAGFSHRDLKPHNILLSEDWGKPVIMDLGSVSRAQVEITTRQQQLAVEDEAACKTSAAYRAPELTQVPQPPYTVTESVDIWGLGCTLYCLAFGRSPFETPREGVLRLAILNGKFSYPPANRMRECTFSTDFIGLINSMIQIDATVRPSAADVSRRCLSLIETLGGSSSSRY